MRSLAGVLLAALFIGAAFADELVTANVVGFGVQTCQATSGAKISWQCPNQVVYYRPGGCAGCVVDAGPTADGGVGDFTSNFFASPDPWGPVTLRTGYTKMHFRNVDAGYLSCSCASVSP